MRKDSQTAAPATVPASPSSAKMPAPTVGADAEEGGAPDGHRL